MDTRRLHNFIAVVDAGSIARAALALHLAQPALSAQMRQLEEHVGAALLSRSAKGVIPTAVGLAFYRKAQELLKQMDSLLMLGRDMSLDPVGHVTLGCPTSLANLLAVPLVEAVSARYPRLTLGLLESPSVELSQRLADRTLDLAILFSENVSANMRHDTVVEEGLFVVSAQPLPAEMSLTAIRGLPLVMPARPNSVRLLLDDACADANVALHILAEISSPHTMLQLARHGLGATILPWSMLAGHDTKGLSVSHIVSPRLRRTISIATRASEPELGRVLAIRLLLQDLLRSLVTSSRWNGARLRTGRRRKAVSQDA